VTSDETQRALAQMLGGIWRRSQGANAKRVAVLEAAYAAFQNGSLTPVQRAAAEREAHKLAGGLGSFGLSAASAAARSLEQFWRAVEEQRTGWRDQPEISDVLAFLRREIESPLPRSVEEAYVSDATAARHPMKPSDSRPNSGPDLVDVVVVDDDPTIGALVAARLGLLGYSVQVFEDGTTALAALSRPDPSVVARVILLDYDLPGPDGLSVLRALRDGGVLADTRLIMLTLSSTAESVARIVSAGAHGYIGKPFRWADLVERVESCLVSAPPLFVVGATRQRPQRRQTD